MRFLNVTASLILSLSATPVTHAVEDQTAVPNETIQKYEYQTRRGLEIRVLGGGWGNARAQDIETVLYSVATVLLENFPGKRLNPILVAHSDEHPITLYKKGSANEYQVFLTAKDRRWAQYAYEFAHELSHILTNYEHHAYSNLTTYNQWFEEALCEVASLYALKQLAYVWEISPPYPHWAKYAPQFERYLVRLSGERHRRLPPNTSLATWFQKNENELRRNPYLRSHNEVVANLLLPLFEGYPDFWEAIGYLHLAAKGSNFQEYMQNWHANAPEDYQDIIKYVMALFGILENGQANQTVSPQAPRGQPAAKPEPQGTPQTGAAGSTLR